MATSEPLSGSPGGVRRHPEGTTRILVVCTANQCRSPVAAALLAARLAQAGVGAVVESAGLFGGDQPVPPEMLGVGDAHGIDLRAHRSRAVTPEDVDRADLVLGMARQHVRQVVVDTPSSWPRAFTLIELVRRAGANGPRPRGRPLSGWLEDLTAGRRSSDLLGEGDDDVADPMGGPLEAYAATTDALAVLTAELVRLAWPGPAAAHWPDDTG